jgi:aryl-alcohol dehydrogenase
VVRIVAAVSRREDGAPELEELELEEPRAGEVLVRLAATGICHTDLHVHSTRFMSPKPIVLGHEGAGVVERVGEGVDAVFPGDHVILCASSCGACPSCRANAPTYCADGMQRNFGGARPDGSTPLSTGGEPVHARFFGQSSFATYAVADARSAVPVPAELPLELLAALPCGVLTGAGSVVHALRVRPGSSITVFGAGAVGLSAVMAARVVGAARIVAVDVLAHRLELARELGATEVVDASRGEAVDPPNVDYTLNTTTVGTVFTQALEALAPLGVACFVATPEPGWAPDMFAMLSGGRTLRGTIGGDAVPWLFVPTLLEWHRQGRFPFDRLIRQYAFDEIGRAFHDSERGDTIKPVLRMP